MAKNGPSGGSPQPWQRALADNPPSPSGRPGSVSPGQLRQFENAQPMPVPVVPAPPPIPTDAKGFQKYLNDHGAKPALKVDGIIGAKTLAAAQKLNIPVPENLVPRPATPPSPTPAPLTTGTPPAATTETTVDLAAPVVPRATIDEIRGRYGYLGALLDQPDIASVIAGYDSTVDSDDQLLARIKNTPTFQQHSTSELNWLALKPTDKQAAVNVTKAAITDQASRLGVSIVGDRLEQIAADANRLGWSPTQVQQAIASEFHYKPGGQTGKVGQAEAALRRMAASYLMPLSDDTLAQWDAQVAAGADPEQFRQGMIATAKARFPVVAKLLDQGATMLDVTEPYRQTAAKTLGRSPDSIDFTDPQWSRVLSNWDSKQGQFSLMSDYDWQKLLKTDPAYGWQTSQPGRDQATLGALALLRGLEKVPG